MIEALQGLGLGILGLAIIIGIGIVVLNNFATTVSSCGNGFSYQTNGTATYTTGKCCNVTTYNCTHLNAADPSTASSTMHTIGGTYIATNLTSWIPVIIVLVIGLLFMGSFLLRGRNKS